MRELSLHILDILQNSIAAGATRVETRVEADSQADRLTMRVTDNGRGMSPEFLARVTDPFVTTRTTRKVGLGIPMLTAAAEMCGGGVKVRSTVGEGTSIEARFGLNHIDREPFGDIVTTMVTTIASNPEISFLYEQVVDGQAFTLDTDEIRRELEGFQITDPAILRWIRGYMKEGITSIGEIA